MLCYSLGGVSGMGLPYVKVVSYGGVIGSQEERGGRGQWSVMGSRGGG